MTVPPIRIFKALFGLGVAGLFFWFWTFWNETFAAGGAAPNRVVAAEVAAPGAGGAVCDLPSVSLPVEDAGETGPPARGAGRSSDLASLAVGRMFQARIHGPYSLSVRDGLNEMVIGTSLLARGVLGDEGGSLSMDAVLGAIPAQLPTHGYISSGFGYRRSPFSGRTVHHRGIDFAVSRGAPVYATADGVVTFAKWYRALGRMVVIDHGYGIVTKYGHNSALTVRAGDLVRRGDVIARAGSSGRSTGSHVHYEVWVNGKAIDPSQFMFDVPDRSVNESGQLALSSYRASGLRGGDASHPHGLGLAVGGEGAELSRETPPPYDREGLLPLNFAVVGLFAFASVVIGLSLWPRRVVLGCDVV